MNVFSTTFYPEYISEEKKKVTSLNNTVVFTAKFVLFILFFLLVYGIYTKQSFSNLGCISCTFPRKDKKYSLMGAVLSPLITPGLLEPMVVSSLITMSF